MAAYIFTKAMFEGQAIPVFNHGQMKRDFTYIDDVVAGMLAALDRPPTDPGAPARPHRLYNPGNHKTEDLGHFIAVLERATGRTARKDMQELQPGDVPATYADIEASTRDVGFHPTTTIEDGSPQFVDWYRWYHGV